MIVPNLMVSDMARSVRFYRDILGMTLTMTVSPEREVGWPGEASGAAFAVLEWDGAQLMLQTVESLAGELAVFAPDHAPAPSGTIYFRGLHRGRAGPCDCGGCREGAGGGTVGVSMGLGGMSGTGALDPRSIAYL